MTHDTDQAHQRRYDAVYAALHAVAANWGSQVTDSFLTEQTDDVLRVFDELLHTELFYEYGARWKQPDQPGVWTSTWGFATAEGARNHLAHHVKQPGTILRRLVAEWEETDGEDDEGDGDIALIRSMPFVTNARRATPRTAAHDAAPQCEADVPAGGAPSPAAAVGSRTQAA